MLTQPVNDKYPKPNIWVYLFASVFIISVLSILTYYTYYIPKQIAALKQTKAPHTFNQNNKINSKKQKPLNNINSNTNSNKNKNANNTKKTVPNQEQTFAAQSQYKKQLKTASVHAAPFNIKLLDKVTSQHMSQPALVTQHSDSFNFPVNDFKHTLPLSDALMSNLNNVKDFLKEDYQLRLTITGLYVDSEKNNSMFPNLGLARANDVKAKLISLGVLPKQINIAAGLNNNFHSDSGIYYSMVDFRIHKLNADALVAEKNDIALLKERITREPLVLSFEMGEAAIGMTEKQRQKILQIIRFVGKKKDARVKIVGHTDNLGTEENNKGLGIVRAEFAAKFLIDNGLDANAIRVYSRGESQPIATNLTDTGRATNRRAVITVE